LVHIVDHRTLIWTISLDAVIVNPSVDRQAATDEAGMTRESRNRLVIDWGSSNFRAYRFGASGQIAERHQANAGILTVTDGGFEEALMREIGQWITPQSEILFSGMITSRNGWVETPYIAAPARLDDLASDAIVRHGSTGATYRFLPGVCVRSPLPDVMRGEEIQVFGAIEPEESATVILPGTHSKWVNVTDGVITRFRTFLTGESYALLARHSIVGRLIPPDHHGFNGEAFLAGVTMARHESSISFLNDVFTTRSGALLGAFGTDEIADRLSGLLIGHEIKAGLGLHSKGAGRLILVGEEELAKRYERALREFGHQATIGRADAVVEGFSRLAARQRD
jgi:2-dehydro-3-deoxygalactonokinase